MSSLNTLRESSRSLSAPLTGSIELTWGTKLVSAPSTSEQGLTTRVTDLDLVNQVVELTHLYPNLFPLDGADPM